MEMKGESVADHQSGGKGDGEEESRRGGRNQPAVPFGGPEKIDRGDRDPDQQDQDKGVGKEFSQQGDHRFPLEQAAGGEIDDYPEAEIVQLQVNYLDWDSPSFRERECVEIARAHGLPVAVMEPVKGGLLADPSKAVKAILDEAMPNDSYATAALRFAASVDGVYTTLSGMSTVEQVEDNMRVFADFQPLTAQRMHSLRRLRRSVSAGHQDS